MSYTVTRTELDSVYQVERTCPECREACTTRVPAQGLWLWEHGTPIQDAFPELEPGDREQIRSGVHASCWKQMFGPMFTPTP